MSRLKAQLADAVVSVLYSLYAHKQDAGAIKIDETPPEFEGDLTIVVFPFTRISRKSPDETAHAIGHALCTNFDFIGSFGVVKGFLNLVITDAYWIQTIASDDDMQHPGTGKTIAIEYCGPNTNKPLHLGHVRNMLLGAAVANLLEAAGNTVHRVNIYNDRGIAICKSMVAYLRSGQGKTPGSEHIKGDHFVGDYYVEYQRILEREVGLMEMGNMSQEDAEKQADIALEARDMLLRWEKGDPEVIALWELMNGWVYEGFLETYEKLGIRFEKDYRESEFYVKGKDLVYEGLNKGIFYRDEDGSIRVDLSGEGLDQKVLLRSDGTSVYITQDMGVARQRFRDYAMDLSIYVVANEQDYHFKVLRLILEKLGEPYAKGIFHLSYGMVDLPEGKMKSRQGNVVDADDLVDGMIAEAAEFLAQSEKSAEFSASEKQELAKQIGLGALKYFILRVDPKKRMLFDPKESIDLQGNTGPFIQYAYARIRSVLRKSPVIQKGTMEEALLGEERDLLIALYRYREILDVAAAEYSPAMLAAYLFDLAKKYNKMYADHPILRAESSEKKFLRLQLSERTSEVLRAGLAILGIEAPESM